MGKGFRTRVAGERDALGGLGDARVAEDPALPVLISDRHQVLLLALDDVL